ncbi:MAG: ATP F0F1 synthase synthase [Firmicutes bacterium]|nr:ATP F0F1 synthase synthase [Bacillota bacterium]
MNTVFVKIGKSNTNSKYRKMLSTDGDIYPKMEELIEEKLPYNPGAALEDCAWFVIKEASKQPFAIEFMKEAYDTLDFDSLDKREIEQIDFICVKNGKNFYFQKVSKARLVSKRSLVCLGEEFEFQTGRKEIVINDAPDAIYCPDKDELYFRKLESVVSIFRGINDLYREATQSEVENFMNDEFIKLCGDYSAAKVKTANRKRIALVKDSLTTLDEPERQQMIAYIEDYCPQLKRDKDSFEIGSEEELKWLLYGVQEKFYTTAIGKERRLANSTIKMEA